MRSFFCFSLTLFVLLNLINFTDAIGRPSFAVEVFRNGARQPTNQKYNPFNFTRPGELTPMGFRQQYNLGLFMQKKYGYLLDKSNLAYIYAQSFNSNKCRQSVEAQILGALQGKDSSELPQNLPKSPLIPVFEDIQLVNEVMADVEANHSAVTYNFHPIFNVLDLADQFKSLSVSPNNCDLLRVMQDRRQNDAEGAKIYKYLTETVTGIKKLGYQVEDIASLSNFGDALQIMYLEGRNAELPEELRYGTTMYKDAIFANEWFLSYTLVGDKSETAIRSTALLTQIIKWFRDKSPYYNTLPLKFAFMGGDEGNLLALLNLYDIVNPTCLFENHKASKIGQPTPFARCIFPKYASHIIYEFHRGDVNHHIRFLYNGKALSICSSTDNEFLCDLDIFAQEMQTKIQNLVPNNHGQYCDARNAPEVKAPIEVKEETAQETKSTEESNTSSGQTSGKGDVPSQTTVEQPKNETDTTTKGAEPSDNVVKNTDHQENDEEKASGSTDSSDNEGPKKMVITSSSSSSGHLAVIKVFVFCLASILVLILLILIYRAVVAHKMVYEDYLNNSNSKDSKRGDNETVNDESPYTFKPGVGNELEQQVASPDNVRLVMS